MAATADGQMHVYSLNVGQGDTTVIVTPQGNVLVIDATLPAKVRQFLADLGAAPGREIETLVITHPHIDHYSGAASLVRTYRVLKAVLCPFWQAGGMGPPTYCQVVAALVNGGAQCQFLSGYTRVYPDGLPPGAVPPQGFEGQCAVELLGPSNSLLTDMQEQDLYDTNHLSIMSRVTWQGVRIVIAADAQMENWSVFDSEHMARDGYQVLRAAHHGSGNGTQWERLSRFKPGTVIVSSDRTYRHRLPDVTGASVFARYERSKAQPLVALTGDVGTIEVVVDGNGNVAANAFGDARYQNIDVANRAPLTWANNPTDWRAVLIGKANLL
jgi:competence protein ComEC